MADPALVEETEKRLRSQKGVHGFLVLNGDGIAIRSSMENAETVHYAALVSRCSPSDRDSALHASCRSRQSSC